MQLFNKMIWKESHQGIIIGRLKQNIFKAEWRIRMADKILTTIAIVFNFMLEENDSS